jgi:hypothetical protein
MGWACRIHRTGAINKWSFSAKPQGRRTFCRQNYRGENNTGSDEEIRWKDVE